MSGSEVLLPYCRSNLDDDLIVQWASNLDDDLYCTLASSISLSLSLVVVSDKLDDRITYILHQPTTRHDDA